MHTFPAPDGTPLAYHPSGTGAPLICLPGGPMRDSAYLGDLGGLADTGVPTVRLDLRGTGDSGVPADPGSYACERQVEDVEALRRHLGLDRIRLLGHSAGAALAVLYTARHPERVSSLVLVTPQVEPLGEPVRIEDRLETARLRKGEEWFPAAYAAMEAIAGGRATEADWAAAAPLSHGRWDEAARAHRAAGPAQRHPEAAAAYGAEDIDPDTVRTALGAYGGRALLLAGEFDVASPPRPVTACASAFPDAETAVLTGAGHFPWHDDPAGFTSAVAGFLA
ncbi:alpha/beta fold hydrolase [Streptomyces sanyensis]|uniref:alpha/beta fold hydrolase n=1 Tax=Streptomyces sanyensis TaxID=568869 RepID=UPI003D7821FC